jgi:hypothetical protein
MFDTLKALWLGFSGSLSGYGEARRLVWLLLVAFLAGWLATVFAAWISFPSYYSTISYLPGSMVIGWAFTLGIAGFLYFVLSYLSGYLVERWKRITPARRNYTALGARIFTVCAILFLCVDMYMNLQGSEHRAKEAAGNREKFTYQTPAETADMLAGDKEKLTGIEAGKVGGYGWRDPKTGIFWLNTSGKRAAADLRGSIRRAEQSDSTARAAFLADIRAANSEKAAIEGKAQSTLKNAVYGVYILIFLLGIVQGYITETIQAAGLEDRPEDQPSVEVKKKRQEARKLKRGNGIKQAATGQPRPAIAMQGKGYQIECKHCGESVVMKSHLAKYCGPECRQAAWEKRTGAKLKKGKKTGVQKIGF